VFDAPEFILLDPVLPKDLNGAHYDLAIVDACGDQSLTDGRFVSGKPAIVIHSDATLDFCVIRDSLIQLHREPLMWPAVVGLVGREILRRREAEDRRDQAEKTYSAAQSQATLGRYMLDMRINVNNALTTLLGNAELLSFEAGLPSNIRAQADTIRNMALRLHEIFQRFSSLDKELGVSAKESSQKNFAAASSRD
jgi:PAS domain-containing protein